MKLGNLEINWLGHSAFQIQNFRIPENSGNSDSARKSEDFRHRKTVFIDPYKIKSTKKADLILITHSHYDHCSIEDLQKIVKDGTIIVMPGDCQSKFSRMTEKLIFKIIEPGQELIIGDIKIKAVPAYNINKNFHGKAEYWNGYILQVDGKKIYHAGDTDLIPEMTELANYNLDLALLPVDGIYTMSSQEAMRAAVLIRAKSVMPIHPGNPEDSLRLKHLCDLEGINCIIERSS